MSLDEKLKELHITSEDNYGEYLTLSSSDVEAIKQAFIDEGWVPTYVTAEDAYYECERCGNHVQEKFRTIHGSLHTTSELPERMTGPEWLARLMNEVDTNMYHESDPEFRAQWGVIDAARRAAGVDESH